MNGLVERPADLLIFTKSGLWFRTSTYQQSVDTYKLTQVLLRHVPNAVFSFLAAFCCWFRGRKQFYDPVKDSDTLEIIKKYINRPDIGPLSPYLDQVTHYPIQDDQEKTGEANKVKQLLMEDIVLFSFWVHKNKCLTLCINKLSKIVHS